MSAAFSIRRFLLAFVGGAIIIASAQLLKGHTLRYALAQAALWAAITATVFLAACLYQSRPGQHRAICRETLGMLAPDRDET